MAKLTLQDLIHLLDTLRSQPKESEWIEFKVNNSDPDEIGENISALANAASLHHKIHAYIVFGIEDGTHSVVGTDFKPRQTKIRNEELENWLLRQLNPRLDFVIHEFNYNGLSIVLLEIEAAKTAPVKFKNIAHIRVGSYTKKLVDFPEKERKIWKHKIDWSAQICEEATLNALDAQAISKARVEFKQKNPHLANEVDGWSESQFLNKAKITIGSKITHTAIILLGKPESEHFLNPSIARISWILRDGSGQDIDYEHFGIPLLINAELVFAKIRNLNYRYLPDNTLFPIEITQYDPWVIREALHNCIAHQDYDLHGKINLVETPGELMFSNVGSFIPGSVETVIQRDAPPDIYRNALLAHAMENLNMIDTIGSGIKKMFLKQRNRFFPLPDYDLSQSERVVVRIQGRIIDPRYTRLLKEHTELDLSTVILLDKVQKRLRILKDEHKQLKEQNLVEGRYPNIFVSSAITLSTSDKAQYIKNRAFDDQYYKDQVIQYIKRYGCASRQEIDQLLLNKLSDVLDKKQKRTKIGNLLYLMSKKDKSLENIGLRSKPKWILRS
ncbi:MAG: putative DNA binding domain-containing protein [Sedimentisphaerales bacterium]|nr:putative DNA binding domain-containing protein [Sedimentisphaerales bacterium]